MCVLLLLLCPGCKEEAALNAKNEMLEVVFWLMQDSEIPPPHEFDLIRIRYGDCTVELLPDEQQLIRDLQEVLSSKELYIPEASDKTEPSVLEDRIDGVLELEQGGYSYQVSIATSGSDLLMEIIVPGDGISVMPLPGKAEPFKKLMDNWCESKE